MVIEFYGIPGSGKTTLAKELVRRNPERFIYLHSSPRSEILRLVPLFCLRHPRISFFWFKELLRECARGHFLKLFRYKLHLLFISIAQYQKSKKFKDKIALIDEGLLQRIFTIYDSPQPKSKVDACVSHLPKIDLFIRAAHEESMFRRVLVPPYTYNNPRVELGEEYLKNWMSGVMENYKITSEILRESRWRILLLKKDNSVEENVLAVLQELGCKNK